MVAASAGFLAKRRVHDVGAASRSDWTRRSNRGTKRRLARSVGASRWSPRVWRYQLQALLRLSRRSAYATRARLPNPKRLWTLPQPWTHRTRPPLLGNLAEEREIPTSVHSPFPLSSEEKNEEYLRRQLSRFMRFQVSADTRVIRVRRMASRRSAARAAGDTSNDPGAAVV